jgi:hypothetical protein
VQLLDNRIILFLTFSRITKLFPTVAASGYSSTSNAQSSPILVIFFSFLKIIAILIGIK